MTLKFIIEFYKNKDYTIIVLVYSGDINRISIQSHEIHINI